MSIAACSSLTAPGARRHRRRALLEPAGYVDPGREAGHLEGARHGPPVWSCSTWSGSREIVRGELGKSYRYDLPAWQIIRPLLPVTLELAGAVHRGLGAARRADRRDQRGPPGRTARLRAARVSAWPGSRMPSFWLAHGDHPRAGALVRLDPADDLRAPRRESAAARRCSSCCPRSRSAIARSALIMRITRSAHAGGAARGLHPHRAGQGPARRAVVVWRHALKNAIAAGGHA